MKKLLITGGTGFFGRALLRQIKLIKSSNGYLPFDHITVLSRYPEIFKHKYPELSNLPWLEMQTGDVLIPTTLPKNVNFNYILHAASDSTNTKELTPIQVYRQIVDGTENMLKFAVSIGVERFLFTSSGGAYGPQPINVSSIAETYNGMPDPLNPLNSYGIAKRQAEHLCAQYENMFGIQTVIARCFSFVGEDLPRNAHFAIGNFIRDAMERKEIIVNGSGNPIRSYMYQSDLAIWLLTILRRGASGKAYNVGSDIGICIIDVAKIVRDILSPHKEIVIKKNISEENEFRNIYVPDVSKAKTELDLRLTVTFENAIKLSAQI